MTGQEFKRLISPMFRNPVTSNIYAVVEDGNQKVVKKLNIKDELQTQLQDSLIKDYNRQVEKITDEAQLANFSINSDHKGVFCFDMNEADFYMCAKLREVDSHKNDDNYYSQNSGRVFKKEDSTDSIIGIIYNIGHPNQSCFIYRNYKKPKLFHKNKILSVFDTNEFVPFEKSILCIDPQIDFLFYENHFFIFDAISVGRYANVKTALREKATEVCNSISNSFGLNEIDSQKLTSALENNKFVTSALKLLDENGNLPQIEKDTIKNFINEHGENYQIKVEVNEDNLSLDNDGAEYDMLNLIGDNYLYSEMTEKKFLADGKTQILQVQEL